MRKIVLASSVAISLIMIGCGSRSIPTKDEQTLVVKSVSPISSNKSDIKTQEDYTTITLYGEFGSKVFINGEEVGTFPESGSLEVTFNIKEIGDYTYLVKSVSKEGVDGQTITIEVKKEQKSATLGSVHTGGAASALTVSKDGIIFIAEKNHGVEIISIGFNDKVSSDLLATIDTSDAVSVVLSEDEKTLYVEDKKGKFHVLDISNLSNPFEIKVIDKLDKTVSIISENQTKRYRVSACGLIGEDISNPAKKHRDFILKDKKISDAVLVEEDTKLLVAHGKDGLQLYDLSNPKAPIMIAQKVLGGDTMGLSLLKKDGVLFVANGANGVEIFDLDILLYEMTH